MTATYRLQLHSGFTFADAEARVPYLADLGISHLYLSPVLQAVHGSMHGYDVVDHTRISDELGGEQGLVSLAEAAYRHGLGLVVDVVPNHMAFVAPEHANTPLWQVLRDGRDAATGHWFDIDWEYGEGRLGLPVLGGTLPEALAAGEITKDQHDDEPVIRYFDHVFPIAPGTENGDVAQVLERQHYRLASWREADLVLNYRRFFDVTELIAIRVELPDVFEQTHRVLLDLNDRQIIDGFRIDHPDGLADPEGYLTRLRAATRPGTFIWVEKILEGAERLPDNWACEGTTGYDAMLAVTTALVDPTTTSILDAAWAATGAGTDLEDTILDAKRKVVRELFGAEVHRLGRRAREVYPNADPDRVEQAIGELLVAGEVYRAYVRLDDEPTPLARRRLYDALAVAVDSRPDLKVELEQLVAIALPGGESGDKPGADRGESRAEDREEAADDFALLLQQTWGPVMAKGIEDTTFYRWRRLVALNEVGGDPAVLAEASPEALHSWAVHQQTAWPSGMTGLSTHDTKRSEDVRARLLAVAADAISWVECSKVFAEAAEKYDVDRPTAHLLWQTVVGAGDISSDRLRDYLTKAVREAKQQTTWTEVNADYESRVAALADAALTGGALRETMDRAISRNTEAIRAAVLGQKLIQLTLPGIPDIYQGCELVNLSLVDPDNRRPVDYDAHERRLHDLEKREPTDLDDEKLLVTTRALGVRIERPGCFDANGDYTPLLSSTEHAVGFLRGGAVVTVVTRAQQRLAAAGGWKDDTMTLPMGVWHDELTGATFEGGEVACADVFAKLPVALLVVRDA